MLRASLRQRALLVEQGAQHLQHRQKSLTQRNLKLDPMNLPWNSVLSDITGVTGLLIIDAILNGERNPLTLARLRDERCRHDEATLAKALVGTWRVEHLFTLRQARELYRTMQRLVAECDAQIEEHLQSLADRPAPPPGPDLPPARKKPRRKGRVAFDAQPLLEHKAGVDLTRIDANTALTVIGEIGLDMSRWPTEKQFASWLASLSSIQRRPSRQPRIGRSPPKRSHPPQCQPRRRRVADGGPGTAPFPDRARCLPAPDEGRAGCPQSHHCHGPQTGPDDLPRPQARPAVRRSRPRLVRTPRPRPPPPIPHTKGTQTRLPPHPQPTHDHLMFLRRVGPARFERRPTMRKLREWMTSVSRTTTTTPFPRRQGVLHLSHFICERHPATPSLVVQPKSPSSLRVKIAVCGFAVDRTNHAPLTVG